MEKRTGNREKEGRGRKGKRRELINSFLVNKKTVVFKFSGSGFI
jgi:hypothetical protein